MGIIHLRICTLSILALLLTSGCLDIGDMGKLQVRFASLELTSNSGDNDNFERWPSNLPPLFQNDLDVSQCTNDDGYACVILNTSLPEPSDSEINNTVSKVRIFENGIEIGPRHARHDDIRIKGKGRYSHWKGTLRLSATDFSDPKTNGKKYTYGIEGVYTPPTPAPTIGNFNQNIFGGDQVTIPVTEGVPPYTFSVVSGGGSFNGAVYTAPIYSSRVTVRVTDATGKSSATTLRSMVLHYIGGYRDGGGSQNNSWSSHDGATWVAQKPLPIAMQGISLAVLNDVLHILGGFTNAAAAFTFQTDNVTNDWQATPNLPRSGEMAGRLVHNGQIYLAAQDRILISSDGLNFSMHGSMPLAPQPMGGTRMTFFNGRFWLVGGSNFSTTEVLSTVYSSTDAKTWTKVGDLPSPKYAGALYSYDGKMFYVAGLNANQTAASEVFMTTDGVNWRLITYAPRPRELVRGVVYKNKMWLIGGMINGVAQKESWTSTDGLTWTNVGSLPEGRANGDVVVY